MQDLQTSPSVCPPSEQTSSTILIVDDVPENLRLLSAALTQAGYEVRGAISGSVALMSASIEPPDLIMLDVTMPKMDGFEVCRRLKSKVATAEIPVVFISALGEVFDKVKAFEVGGVDYITKPFQTGEVLARVKSQLELGCLKQQLQRQNQHLQNSLEQQQWAEAQVRQLNSELEDRVEERTKQLLHLAETQMQLVQTEKMASLGKMVAGIAHEINNPINFIQGNLTPLSDYLRDLVGLLETYQEAYPTPTEAVLEKREEVEVEFLVKDITKILSSMDTGTQRVRDIIVSLRNFSRLDESAIKDVDLCEGLDSTLLILNHRIKEGVTILKDYHPLPLVRCSPAQINQVFTNIIINALDAIFEADAETKQIEISTRTLPSEYVQVCIKDNGPGIPPDVESKIVSIQVSLT
ncbi:MAG: response regulator [Phormidesmis sp.]